MISWYQYYWYIFVPARIKNSYRFYIKIVTFRFIQKRPWFPLKFSWNSPLSRAGIIGNSRNKCEHCYDCSHFYDFYDKYKLGFNVNPLTKSDWEGLKERTIAFGVDKIFKMSLFAWANIVNWFLILQMLKPISR